jgi:hypothetical protein
MPATQEGMRGWIEKLKQKSFPNGVRLKVSSHVIQTRMRELLEKKWTMQARIRMSANTGPQGKEATLKQIKEIEKEIEYHERLLYSSRLR